MTRPAPAGAERHTITAYLDEVGSHLPGSARTRRDILEELEHGLHETVLAHTRRGLGPAEAAGRAIVDFGAPRDVAAAHAPEIRLRQVRSSAWTTVVMLVLAGALWQGYRHAVGDLTFMVPGGGWSRQAFLALTDTMPFVAGVAQLAAIALLLVSARALPATAPGRAAMRWLTVTLAAAMTVMLANMVAILALVPTDMPVLHRWAVPVALVTIGGVALTHSLLSTRRARAIDD